MGLIFKRFQCEILGDHLSEGSDLVYVVYVDDILVTGNNSSLITKII